MRLLILLAFSVPVLAFRHVGRMPARCLVTMAAMAAADIAQGAPLLRCEFFLSGVERSVDFPATDDPYSVRSLDLDGRFRFKAVMKAAGTRVEYVKTQVFAVTARQPTPLQVAYYATPQPGAHGAQPLTGIQRVYSPDLGRELEYSCSLQETAP